MRTVPEMLSGDPNSHHSSFLSLLTRPEEPPSSSSPLQVVSQDNKGFHSGWLQPIQSVHSTLQQQQYTVRSLGLDTMWNRSEIFHHLQSICIQNISIAIRDQRNTESWQLRADSWELWSISITQKSIRNVGSQSMTTLGCPDGVMISPMSPNHD